GGALALFAGARYPDKLAGIMGLSCYLLLAGRLAAERAAANQATAVFLAHGTQDPVIAPALGEEARRQLEAAGYAVEWHAYSMPHAVCPQEVADIAAWLRRVL
ncbi:MAG TPA: carboxylesterase, partial [Chloroflexota bacterium]|nr:carboxylesterase [Chloroflexota bacterium]